MSKRRKTGAFSISFTVNNFSEVKGNVISPVVIVNDVKWKIWIKPNNVKKDVFTFPTNGTDLFRVEDGLEKKSLGYFLQCDGIKGGSPASTWSCQATTDLRVMSVKKGVDNYSREISHLFKSKCNNWGYPCYMKWDDIENAEQGLIEDDSVTFLARITADEPEICDRCEERSCKVCLKEEVCIVFDPCKHLATCSKCSPKLNECPVCRGKIDKKFKVFV